MKSEEVIKPKGILKSANIPNTSGTYAKKSNEQVLKETKNNTKNNASQSTREDLIRNYQDDKEEEIKTTKIQFADPEIKIFEYEKGSIVAPGETDRYYKGVSFALKYIDHIFYAKKMTT